MKKPGFWRLLGAYGVDFVITFSIVWGCCHLLVSHFGTFTLIQVCGIYISLVLIPCILYFAGSECVWKKTIGKWLLGVKVLEESKRLFVEKLFTAYGIDFLFLVPGLILCILVYVIYRGMSCWGCGMSGFDWCVVAGFLSVIVLYFPICESCWGKTLGKKLMGLQVVQATPQKQKEETK